VILDKENYLAHFGVLRKSGRYPWGSGNTQSARNKTFLDVTEELRREGMSDVDIAKGFGLTTTQLRAARTIAGNEQKLAKIAQAQKLKDKGLSNTAIGEKMGLNESSVRSLLDPGQQDRANLLQSVSSMLERQVEDKQYVQIGVGVENQLGISGTKLKNAVAVLEEKGYVVRNVQVPQIGSKTKTTVKVLAPPGTTYRDIVANMDKIRLIDEFSDDGGRTMLNILPPINIDSKRIKVKYADEGGKDEDGMLYIRPGIEDLSIGKNRYAQVRVAVDGTHFLKGMAMYKDDLPEGVDLLVNSDKRDTGNKLDAMKPQKKDSDNPFGASIRQSIVIGPDGKPRVTSAMNYVGTKEGAGEEGSWDTWSKSLSSQVLSKQKPKLAQQQLDVTYERSKQEFEELKSLTNPVIRRHLLDKFSQGADSSAVHLAAAALPRQATKVILPVKSLKDTEVYAPTFNNGERVALIRYPHGGTFEIPVLTVNNKHRESRKLLGSKPEDAIGINPKVAERLSGADFDGDFVVVIPNNKGQIESTPALKALKDFDPQRLYKLPDDAPEMSPRTKGQQMGLVSNLITDMTIKGAPPDEIARAIKHSMVVIDAEKHHLDYKRSAIDNGIQQLNLKYQNKPRGGAATIISKAKSQTTVPDRKLRSARDGGPIDPKTGKLVYEDQPQSFVTSDGRTIIRTRKSKKLAETDDAFTLVSLDRHPIEVVYANHSNRMKALANEARKEVAAFKPPLISKSAKQTYASDVETLNAKLSLARKNKPLERQAQLFANAVVAQKKAADPDMSPETLKKIQFQALEHARTRTGAAKYRIHPSPSEWAAIQAGAVSHNQLKQILDNSDIDVLRELATPRTKVLMTSSKQALASSLFARGYTQAEVAERLGVSLSTLKNTL
jgi:hypothetical protein